MFIFSLVVIEEALYLQRKQSCNDYKVERSKQMKAYDILLAHQVKPSLQRIAIMEYMMEHRTHPSAEEVYADLSESMPTLSKTTVYNTLRLFAENGAVLMLTIDDKNVNFDADTSQHAHFLCKKCGKIYDFHSQVGLRKLKDLRAEGHDVEEVHAYYKGICKNCLNKDID